MNSISQKNLELFSKLSGDFNPLHLDQEFAKNSYYGDQVIYGIYQVFLTLENFFKKIKKILKFKKSKPVSLIHFSKMKTLN
ncbi:MaoC/PaaZ C-terminal domain-containing protein [Campylobacter coli]|uniref:MaoC/PaaZ C-terminal domain-containing protein n=1 Tax=Campylobacter coli TaxID=195 RepID=UPI002E31C2DF|nr:MaoC/PaaZ C-terminal domain-containing protein [Campylobacter coli]MED7896099.1 MaoC/PaaZ C-terminal domain-containing protein [Campylobacter coli]